MANVSIDKQLNVKITLDVSESEARAMEALAGYGTKPFLNVFYKHMGRHYLEPHESGLASLFSKIRAQLPHELTAIDNARKDLNNPHHHNIKTKASNNNDIDKCVKCALKTSKQVQTFKIDKRFVVSPEDLFSDTLTSENRRQLAVKNETYKFAAYRSATSDGVLVGIKMLTINDSDACKSATARIVELMNKNDVLARYGNSEVFCSYSLQSNTITILRYEPLPAPMALDFYRTSHYLVLPPPFALSNCDHEWNDDLSTCVKCGDKDWMN